MERFLEISGNENHFNFWVGRAQPISKTPAAHLRHHHIGEEKINLSPAIFADQTLGVIAIGRFDDLVAEVAQDAHRNMPHTDVVLKNENGFGAHWKLFPIWFFVRWRRRRGN